MSVGVFLFCYRVKICSFRAACCDSGFIFSTIFLLVLAASFAFAPRVCTYVRIGVCVFTRLLPPFRSFRVFASSTLVPLCNGSRTFSRGEPGGDSGCRSGGGSGGSDDRVLLRVFYSLLSSFVVHTHTKHTHTHTLSLVSTLSSSRALSVFFSFPVVNNRTLNLGNSRPFALQSLTSFQLPGQTCDASRTFAFFDSINKVITCEYVVDIFNNENNNVTT